MTGGALGAKTANQASSGSTTAPTLGQKVRKGVVATAIGRVGVQAAQFVTTVVLARLLLPSDFGVVALVTTLTGFTALFVDMGLTSAVVQRKEVDERYLATAFWMNAALGVVLALALSAFSPVAARWFDEPQLTLLIPIASLSMVLSLSVVHAGLLRRDLAFKKIARVWTTNAVVTAVIAISGALLGLGPLALVLGSVGSTVAGTVQTWLYHPWRPRTRPDSASAKELWNFTRGILGNNSVNYWSRNADNLLVGKFLGSSALGYYGRAYNLMLMPVSQLGAILSQVLFPTLAKVQDDPQRFGRAWLLSTKASWLIGAPIGIGLCATAPAFVATLFGERWLPMVPVLAFLAASVPAQLIGSNLGAVFTARNRNGQFFKITMVTSALTIVAVVVALPFGIGAVAAAVLIKFWVLLAIPLLPTLKLAAVPLGTFLRALIPSAFLTALMGAGVWLTALAAPGVAAPVLLMIQIAVGALIYVPPIVLLERGFLREIRGMR